MGCFFGTDGIRGEVSLETPGNLEAVQRLESGRTLTPTFMTMLGQSLARLHEEWPGEGDTFVIGWDRRPGNARLVAALTAGLRCEGARVVHIGECATPTLHHAVLSFAARAGCMITASHNPVTDSGIKVFDANGYKLPPQQEENISRAVRHLSSDEPAAAIKEHQSFSTPDVEELNWGITAHRAWLANRWEGFSERFGRWQGQENGSVSPDFLIDSACGFASAWLSAFLNEHGVACREVSDPDGVLNDGCGAGDLSPTATWTHEEARASSHALLRQLTPAPAGQLVGAALDGDGDRCLFIEATEDGFAVVDGDAMGALLLAAGDGQPWSFAASIESDVGLFGRAANLNPDTVCTETAVGDRWLSFALRPEGGGLLSSDAMPSLCGIEDSGHIVLPAPHPQTAHVWSLVGDGAATLCAVLLASCKELDTPYIRGWKQRRSIQDSHRERWRADTALFATTEQVIFQRMKHLGYAPKRRRISGEENLLLVHGTAPNGAASIGIRNSGTQAKTSLSVRLSVGVDPKPFEQLMDELVQKLTAALTTP